MSHFSVLVIGDNVEEQLAPYDENLDVEKHISGDYPEPEKEVENALKYLQERIDGGKTDAAESMSMYLKIKNTLSELEANFWLLNNEWEDNFEIVDGKIVHFTTRNPKSQWDWYQIGGRWSGFFTLKDHGGKRDQANKGLVDFERMRADKATAAAEEYDIFAKATEGMDVPPSWVKFREDNPDMSIEEQRREYNNGRWTDWMKATRELGYFMTEVDYWCGDAEDPRQEFIDRAVDRVGIPYAFVKNGEWVGKGEMGWFGMSSGDEDTAVWNRKVRELIDSLPDDTLLTMVDAHI